MLNPLRALLSLAIVGASSGCIIIIKDDEHWDEPGYGGSEPGYPGYPGDTAIVDDTGEVACTEESYASVLVNIVGVDGLPLSGARVTWQTSDEAPAQDAQCMDELCTSFVAGWEVAGDITITAGISEDTEDPCCWLDDSTESTVTVPMSSDGCHVKTQEVTLMLDPGLICADGENCG